MLTGKGLVINYEEGGGLQNGKYRGSETFCAPPPPPSREGKNNSAPPLKSGNFLRPPPPSIWLKLKATA